MEEEPYSPRSKWFEVTFAAASAATVLPLLLVEILPFTDVPEHLAVMASLRHWWDPAYRIREIYELAALRSQYLLYHFAGATLSVAVGVDWANRLLLAAAGLAQPYAARTFLRAFRRDERLAVFAIPLFWNRALLVGFLPFVASLPVLLYALARVVRHLDPSRPSPRSGVPALALLAVLLFYLHASAFLLLVVIGSALALFDVAGSPGLSGVQRARGLATRLAWLAPSLVVALGWSLVGRLTLRGTSLADEGEIGKLSAFRTIRSFSLWAHDVFRSHGDEVCAVIYWSAFLVLLVAGVRKKLPKTREALWTLVPVVCLVALSFVLPFRIGAATMLNVRMAPVLAIFALVPLELASGLLGRAVIAAVFAVSFATAANAAVELRALVREEAAGVTSLFAHTTKGSRLVSLPFEVTSTRTHFPPFVHMGAYHRVQNGGVSSFSFSELAHWSLQYRPEAAPPKKSVAFWSFSPCLFRNSVDGPYYDFALVKGSRDPFADKPPGPAWRFVDRVKDFALYEKVPGVTWPEWPVPDQGPCRSRDTLEAPVPE